LKAASLFSGGGGMDIGFHHAGFEIVFANDIDPESCKTYEKNIGPIICCDIADVKASDIPDCDVIFGGPPCQGFSIAGKMDPDDPRSQMIWEFLRVIKEKKPMMFVMENVASLLQLEKFKDIRNKLIDGFTEAGYELECRVLNAKDYRVPQSRKRTIIIGSLCGHINFPPIEKVVPTVRDAIGEMGEPGRKMNYGVCKAKITVAKKPVLRSSPYAGMLFNGSGRPLDLDAPAPTITASTGGNKTHIVDQNMLLDREAFDWVSDYHEKLQQGNTSKGVEVPDHLRRLTVAECACLQTFPYNFEFYGSQSSVYHQIGNAVPPQLAWCIALAVQKSLCEIKNLSTNFFWSNQIKVDFSLEEYILYEFLMDAMRKEDCVNPQIDQGALDEVMSWFDKGTSGHAEKSE